MPTKRDENSVSLKVRCSLAFRKAIKTFCFEQRIDMKDFIEQAIREALHGDT
jgi:hypothetical protein